MKFNWFSVFQYFLVYRYTVVAEQNQTKTKTFWYNYYPEKICTLNSHWAQSYVDLKFAWFSLFLYYFSLQKSPNAYIICLLKNHGQMSNFDFATTLRVLNRFWWFFFYKIAMILAVEMASVSLESEHFGVSRGYA